MDLPTLGGYDAFPSGKLVVYSLPDKEMRKYAEDVENLPKSKMRKSLKWQISFRINSSDGLL